MPAGRPTIYNQEMLDKTREYINSCNDTVETVGDKTFSKVNLPTIEGLAYYLKINKDTINEWRKDKEEFSVLIGELLAKQAQALVNNGLSGKYNPTIAKVLLTKHGYREGIEQTGKDGKDLIPDEKEREKANNAINNFIGRNNQPS